MSAIATPEPPDRLLRNSNSPFWLLVPPGMALTLIWSKSSSPEYSTNTPPLTVCLPFTHVVMFDQVWIGPDENAGYGPPSKPVTLSMLTVGILSSISLPGKMYG